MFKAATGVGVVGGIHTQIQGLDADRARFARRNAGGQGGQGLNTGRKRRARTVRRAANFRRGLVNDSAGPMKLQRRQRNMLC